MEQNFSKTTPIITKSLANNGSFEDLLKKITGISVDCLLVMPRATVKLFCVSLKRVNNNLQGFLGTQHQAQTKGWETKPFLIPDFVNTANYNGSIEDKQAIRGSSDAHIVLQAPRSKPKLENISLSMWVAINMRIMHKSSKTGKLSSTSQIADYLSYTLKVFHPCLCSPVIFIIYSNEYCKLQHQYRFCWGSHSKYLHMCFPVKHRTVN